MRSTFPSFGHFFPQGTTRHNWSWQARCSHLLSFSLPLPCRPPSTTVCRRPLPCAAATGAPPAGLSVLGPSVSSQGKASGLRPSDPQISQDRPQRLHRLKGQPSVQPRCWSGWCSEGGSVLQRVYNPPGLAAVPQVLPVRNRPRCRDRESRPSRSVGRLAGEAVR